MPYTTVRSDERDAVCRRTEAAISARHVVAYHEIEALFAALACGLGIRQARLGGEADADEAGDRPSAISGCRGCARV